MKQTKKSERLHSNEQWERKKRICNENERAVVGTSATALNGAKLVPPHKKDDLLFPTAAFASVIYFLLAAAPPNHYNQQVAMRHR